jgi:ADP-heptose:LPS heptosyltransferase
MTEVLARPSLALQTVNKVLVIVFDNIGDVVFTSALFDSLRSSAHLDFAIWCKDYTSEVARLLPGKPRVFASDPFWDKSPLRGKGRIVPFLRRAQQVRREKFDLAIIPNHCWRSAFFARLMGIPVAVGFGKGKNRYFLTHPVSEMVRDQPVMAQMGRLLEPFQDLARSSIKSVYRLELDEPPVLKQAFVATGKPLVILHPFAGSPKRCAPLTLWLEFAKALKGQGYQLLWFGAPQELQAIRRMSQEFEAHEFADIYERKGMSDFAGLMQTAFAYVGHDSGPLHVAHALGAPAFGLYLPSEYQRTFPQGTAPSFMLHRSNPAQLSLEDWLAEWDRFRARAR